MAGVVPTIFAGLVGFHGSNVTVTSTATGQSFAVAGVKSDGSSNVNLLPIVLDKTTWQAMMARTTVDQYAYNPTTGAVTAGADGVTESKLYPVSNGSPGQLGDHQRRRLQQQHLDPLKPDPIRDHAPATGHVPGETSSPSTPA